MYCTGREMVPPFNYRVENYTHLSASNYLRKQPYHLHGRLIANVVARGKKPGQVIKDVNILYLLDPGVKHKPGIFKGACRTHTCPSTTATGVLLQIIIEKIISVVINNFCYCQGNIVLQETFSSMSVTGTKAQVRQIRVETHVSGESPFTAGKRRKHPFPTQLWTIMKQTPSHPFRL